MRAEKTLWILEETLMDEQSDIVALPEFERLNPHTSDEDLGVRSLLEHPEVLLDVAGWHRKPGK